MKKVQNNLFYIVLFLMTIVLSACNGGSGGGTTADPAESGDWDKMAWDRGQWK